MPEEGASAVFEVDEGPTRPGNPPRTATRRSTV